MSDRGDRPRTSHEQLAARAAATYNAAAELYDAPENDFWQHFSRRTVERLGLAAGMRVLDVCCGSGASAVAAADAVGPTGRVVAVDVADEMLALLRRKAAARGLLQLEIRREDLLDVPASAAGFDAVICVFGIFFVADMGEAVRHLWRLVAPGGRLAITTWGPRLVEPASSAFWAAVRDERLDLVRAFNPWDALTEPAA